MVAATAKTFPLERRVRRTATKNGIEWVTHYPPLTPEERPHELASGTRVTIELEAVFKRGKGSVDEYLQQTAIANPHITIHYTDPDGQEAHYERSTTRLPPEAKEIKPHPYGVELGRLMTMLKDERTATTLSQFLTSNFSRVSGAVARRICEAAKLSSRASTKRIGRGEADKLYHAIQETRISAPATDCIAPIGEELLLKGLHQVVPGEFYAADTRPPLSIAAIRFKSKWRWPTVARPFRHARYLVKNWSSS